MCALQSEPARTHWQLSASETDPSTAAGSRKSVRALPVQTGNGDVYFSALQRYLTTHIINNSFASGLHHKVSGSFPAWQQLERWRCPGLCVLVLCVQTDESTHFLLCKSKGTPKMGSAPKFGKLFLVAITVGKKLRLIQKNQHFYKSDCVQG